MIVAVVAGVWAMRSITIGLSIDSACARRIKPLLDYGSCLAAPNGAFLLLLFLSPIFDCGSNFFFEFWFGRDYVQKATNQTPLRATDDWRFYRLSSRLSCSNRERLLQRFPFAGCLSAATCAAVGLLTCPTTRTTPPASETWH